jgi:signal transduction histidine kinase
MKCRTERWLGRYASVVAGVCLLISGSAAAQTNVLTSASAVRSLTVEQAEQKFPVRLRGVVTFFDQRLYSRFVQDETAGIYLYDPALLLNLAPGQMVEVVGTTSPGEYAPIVVPERVSITGTASLPVPKRVTFEQLASGKEDSQFVEITGIVRSIQVHEPSGIQIIEIATGGGRLSVYAQELPVKNRKELLDSTVRVRGVCSTQFNHQRQLFAIRLLVPRPEDLVVEVPAPAEPFNVPTRPMSSLLQFTPQESFGHRVKVSGTVIYFEPGRLLVLQGEDQGLEVQTRERGELQLGDVVEVLGFPAQGVYTPVLQDAIYQKISSGRSPDARVMTPEVALRGRHDCRLIKVTGTLLDRAQYGRERYLILQEGGYIFHAYLSHHSTSGEDAFAGIANGSRVAVTGVCRIDPGDWEAGDQWRAKAFRLQLRTPEDVQLIHGPPWLSLKRMLWMAGLLGLAALAAFGWVAVLHRQVAQRTSELEAEIQERQRAERRREIEQERARVAHDLHDDLGAGLTEVNMLASLVKSSKTSAEEKGRYLDDLTSTAERMVTSLDEIVWAVNPRNDTVASLASYFASYSQRILELATIACGLDVAEDLPDYPLDPKFRQELFLAFKEALTNVVRHSGATMVWLRISVADDALKIELADNGRGFDPGARAAGSDGLTNMQERLVALAGHCEFISRPQQGATVRFRAPLPKRLL